MSDQPLVYVIILTWNGKADTLECLRSLRELRYPHTRLLVVDNASTDGTVGAIRREFPHVELIINDTNLRFAGGNNIGMRYAMKEGAEYVLLLNNDTVVENDFLGELVQAAEAERGAGMVGPKIYYYDTPRQIWFAGGRIEWWKGSVSHLGIRELDRGQHDTMKDVDYLTGCCMLVKRRVIEEIGMLDDAYYIYGEDADWCVRVSRAGYRLLYVPSAVIRHKLSASTGGHLSWHKNWNKFKSQFRLMGRYAKPYHWLTIPLSMPATILKGYLNAKRSV